MKAIQSKAAEVEGVSLLTRAIEIDKVPIHRDLFPRARRPDTEFGLHFRWIGDSIRDFLSVMLHDAPPAIPPLDVGAS